MITDLQTSVLSTEKQISDLKTENERLSQEQVHPDNPMSSQIGNRLLLTVGEVTKLIVNLELCLQV